MRTRTSNRTIRYAIENFDFELSSSEDKPKKRRRDADENDENFDAGAADQSAAEEEEDEDEVEVVNDSASEADVGGKLPRQRARPIKPFNARVAGMATRPTGYLDVELVPPEGQHKGYAGPYDRGMRGKTLVRTWYGPLAGRIEMAHQLLDRWMGWTVLPPKVPHDQRETTDKAFWSPDAFKNEARLADQWHSRVKQRFSKEDAWAELSLEESWPYRFPLRSMPVLMGPHDAQQDVPFEPGYCYPISHTGSPLNPDGDQEGIPSGWVLDVGGVVLGMDWAPRRDKNPTQLLALAIVPHQDQEFFNYEEESVNPDFQKHGIVQVWEFRGEKTDEEFIRPSTERAIHRRTLCLDYGRARRVRWSPACNHLAVLCGDGSVCVVEAGGEVDGEEEGVYYKLQKPLASFTLLDEYGIKATALTWVNCNRLAVGYSDGSIALWSIHPHCLLSRHPVHHNDIVDMVSGYPTMPNLITSVPIGGTARLLDLRAPSYETTDVQRPLVHTQPGLIAYSDHLLGFLSIYPSASALNTIVGYLHHTHFPLARRVFTGDSFLTCLSIGRLHPFLLVGAADGSLWCLNAQIELFSNRHELTDKLRIMQHEHRPAGLFPPDSPAAARGACRILQGFGLEKNRNTKPEIKAAVKKGKKLRAKDPADGMEEDDEVGDLTDPSRAILHEALTRIDVVEWNPNEDYGCWAAVAMGSGLVRIMDLGLEKYPGS